MAAGGLGGAGFRSLCHATTLCLLLALLVDGAPVLDERGRARVEDSASGTASVDFIGHPLLLIARAATACLSVQAVRAAGRAAATQ